MKLKYNMCKLIYSLRSLRNVLITPKTKYELSFNEYRLAKVLLLDQRCTLSDNEQIIVFINPIFHNERVSLILNGLNKLIC